LLQVQSLLTKFQIRRKKLKMDDSLRGVLVAGTLCAIVVVAILNFIVLFPQEQGMVFSDNQSSVSYGVLNQSTMQTDVSGSLTTTNNKSNNAFNDWDVTTGFMGTNTIKQGQTGVFDFVTITTTQVLLMATTLFGANSPIVWALGVIILMIGGYIIYLIVQFVRQGR
jgi:hypothetical protein